MTTSNGTVPTAPKPGRTSVATLMRRLLPSSREEEPVEGDADLTLEELGVLLQVLDQAELRIRARSLPVVVQVIVKLQAQRDRLIPQEGA